MNTKALAHEENGSQSLGLGYAWLIWGLSAAFFFTDYLARVAPGVMHRALQFDFGISEAGFGVLTASFYIPYIAMQIPVGLAVDRISIRKLLTAMAIVTAIGCCVFAMAGSLMTASIGRMLIGFSAAFAFISTLRLATMWFPPVMLGLLAGLTQAMGMLGGFAGVALLSFIVSALEWRYTMLLVAMLFVALAILLYKFIQDEPKGTVHHEAKQESTISIMHSLKIVLSSSQTWYNALYAGFLFVPTAVIGESFGPAYLQYGRGLSAHAAAFATGLIFIGWGIGGPLSGWISDKIGLRKPLMIASALIGFVLSSVIVFYPQLNQTMAYALLLLFGLTNFGVGIAYAVSTEIHSRNVIGTSIAFTNMASIFVGASLQPLVGYLVGLVAGSRSYYVEQLLLSDFQAGLKIIPLCSLVALGLALAVKETYCKPVK